MGTSEMIMDMTEKSDARYALADGIYKDADWLHALVENILSLTRLQDGRLTLQKGAGAGGGSDRRGCCCHGKACAGAGDRRPHPR